MMARRPQSHALPFPTSVTYIALTILLLSRTASPLQTVPGSPCESVCSTSQFGSLEQDVVCLDADYTNSVIGENFRRCVACGLNSTAVDTATNETDVEFALLDMRFALSTCMFAFPIERVSISSPCQVTCQPLSSAIGAGLSNDTNNISPGLGFCTAGEFDDTTINNCASCYGLIPQQLFLANFLQALHVACRQPPVAGQSFFPNAVSIFNESVIAGPTTATAASTSSSGIRGWKLALVIALPIVGFIVLVALSCWGCFVFTRRRRQKMAESGRMNRLHQSWGIGDRGSGYYSEVAAYQPERPEMTGAATWAAQQPMHEMDRITPAQMAKYSQQPPVAQENGEITPVQNAGPGDGQVQDHNLHEQFFGVPQEEVGQAVPMTPVYGGVASPSQQQHFAPPQQYPPEDIAQVSAASPLRGQAGPSFAERAQQQEHLSYDGHELRDQRGEWI